MSMGRYYCAVMGCHADTRKIGRYGYMADIKFFAFPTQKKDPENRQIWLDLLGRKDYDPKRWHRVCSRHFVDGRPTRDNPYPTVFEPLLSRDMLTTIEREQSTETTETQDESKHLRMLQFKNPGKFMEDFDPERSAREMRKMNRRIYRENIKKNQVYDENGIFLENSQDLCDCLDLNCHGCHFPCPKCGSQKCGAECRCGRKWIYEHVEVEGANLILKWPQAENSSKW
uniref:ARL14 effector protein-like isoform X3 n=1 Tax=Crassostrea virginica TaxID=6565 RepID=A0A8B8DWU6_CRAVI|nr:ARL14 effector protein-like isoform X3 [Crassostrea virginica]